MPTPLNSALHICFFVWNGPTEKGLGVETCGNYIYRKCVPNAFRRCTTPTSAPPGDFRSKFCFATFRIGFSSNPVQNVAPVIISGLKTQLLTGHHVLASFCSVCGLSGTAEKSFSRFTPPSPKSLRCQMPANNRTVSRTVSLNKVPH
jgi:hypothetical protein